jgi:cytidyltransferase-like protein
MKFSAELLESAIPEWRLLFIDYVALKKLCKRTAAAPGPAAAAEDIAFFDRIEDELAKVVRFHAQKVGWATAHLADLENAVEHLERTGCSSLTLDGPAASPRLSGLRGSGPVSPSAPVFSLSLTSSPERVGGEGHVLAGVLAEALPGRTRGGTGVWASMDEDDEDGRDSVFDGRADSRPSSSPALASRGVSPAPQFTHALSAVRSAPPGGGITKTGSSVSLVGRGETEGEEEGDDEDEHRSVDSGTVFSLFDSPGRSTDARGGSASRRSLSGSGRPLARSLHGRTPAGLLFLSPRASVLRSGEERTSVGALDLTHVRAFFHEGVDVHAVVTGPTPSSPFARMQTPRAGPRTTGVRGGEEDDDGEAFSLVARAIFAPDAAAAPPELPPPVGGPASPPRSPRPSAFITPHISALPSSSAAPSLLGLSDPRLGVDDYALTFARVRKAVADAVRELDLLGQYVALNDKAVYKALKKRDKRLTQAGLFSPPAWEGARPLMAPYLAELREAPPFAFLAGTTGALPDLRARAAAMAARCTTLEPSARSWSKTAVYSIGCFDTFHHGHANLLRGLRSFGRTVVVGIHDDNSYLALKGSPPADDLPKRMAAVRPYAAQIFVIPSVDPTPFLAAAVSSTDLAAGRAVYVRGDDMPGFPARSWCESVRMPIYLLPRTQAVSSTLIKAVEAAAEAAESGEGDGGAAALSLAYGETDWVGRPKEHRGTGL